MEHIRLKEKYKKQIIPEMMKLIGYKNIHQVPYPRKIIINSGLGEATKNPQVIDECLEELSLICGQKPVVTLAKTAISNFNIRKGSKIGVKVTLRGNKMWDFLDRLVNIVFPRVKDFNGLSRKSFDGKGGYTMGFKEQIVFPEIDPNKIKKLIGFQIIIDTTAKNSKETEKLLELIGMPFVKDFDKKDIKK